MYIFLIYLKLLYIMWCKAQGNNCIFCSMFLYYSFLHFVYKKLRYNKFNSPRKKVAGSLEFSGKNFKIIYLLTHKIIFEHKGIFKLSNFCNPFFNLEPFMGMIFENFHCHIFTSEFGQINLSKRSPTQH